MQLTAFARVLKEFTGAFAAGFDLPRALEMFLDAIGELVRPTRMALLLPDADAQEYRVATHRGLARPIVESVRLHAEQGLARPARGQLRPVPGLQEVVEVVGLWRGHLGQRTEAGGERGLAPRLRIGTG